MPEQFRTSVWGKKTVIQLAEVNDAIIAAVRRLEPTNFIRDGNRLTIDVDDPLTDNPRFVDAVVSAGGHVQYVTELNPALEETYLRIIQETR